MPGTQVLTDEQEIVKVIKNFQVNTKTFWGACVESTLPSFSVGKVMQGYVEASRRGVRILYITEITRENLPHCIEIAQFVVLRHLDGMRELCSKRHRVCGGGNARRHFGKPSA